MSGFTPGEGWREVPKPDGPPKGSHNLVETDSEGYVTHVWVREEPVPALPTAAYTVIRVTWQEERRGGIGDLLMLLTDGAWTDRTANIAMPDNLAQRITSFEVLSEPRAVTAKAVLDRVISSLDEGSVLWESETDAIAREFGVDQ